MVNNEQERLASTICNYEYWKTEGEYIYFRCPHCFKTRRELR